QTLIPTTTPPHLALERRPPPPPPPNTVTKKITLQHYLFLKVAIRTTFKNISGVSVSPMRCTFGK
ncbi:MAG: hypothetical protein ACK5EU_10765, partial [Pseudanabaena sp.]